MIDHVTVSINEANGDVRFLVNDDSKGLLTESYSVKRASKVEPIRLVPRLFFNILRLVFGEYGKIADWTRQWKCYWRVNLKPVGGPVGTCGIKPREYAIMAEVQWLEANFL